MDGPLSKEKSPRNDIKFDDGTHWRAKIGYVLLATEQTIKTM